MQNSVEFLILDETLELQLSKVCETNLNDLMVKFSFH